ncbi:MAG: type II toxin-antitoxin system VapB family antitoxin [Ignavibacteriae bacterium]|nr:type II toxin-antitoxin system VapB family antitoxin [Ignavibacteriota bacterium]
MATNLDIDDALIEEARRLGKHKSKREAVTQALREYTARLRQADVVTLFGSVTFDETYDYKVQRRVR